MGPQDADGDVVTLSSGVDPGTTLSSHRISDFLQLPSSSVGPSGSSRPRSSSMKTVDVLGQQVTQPRERSPHLDQPSLFDNNFQPDEDLRKHGRTLSDQDRPRSLQLLVEGPDGREKDIGDEDFEAARLTGNESDFGSRGPQLSVKAPDGREKDISDEDFEDARLSGTESDFGSLKSLEMINDLGLGDLREPEAATTRTPSEGPSNTDDTPMPTFGEEDISQTSGARSPIAFMGAKFVESDIPIGTEADFAEDANPYDLEAVEDEIRSTLEQSRVGNVHFWPLSQIWRIITPSCVRSLLKSNKTLQGRFQETADKNGTSEDLERYVNEICGSGPGFRSTGRRKILAILVLIDKVESIVDFIDAGVHDLDLPLKDSYDSETKTYYLEKKVDMKTRRQRKRDDGQERESPQNTGLGSASVRVVCQGWSRKDGESFKFNEPRMLAPYLRQSNTKLLFYQIADEAVLPFLEYTRKSEGGYGTVYQVRIHKDHHELEPAEADAGHDMPYYAVKKLHFGDEKDVTRELMVFEKFSGDQKGAEHLIRLLLTYEYKKEYYFVFHWADCNLKELWQEHPQVDTSRGNCHWMINQCVGIATGLRKIHRVTDSFHGEEQANRLPVPSFHKQGGEKNWGRHGDIKPENILWFRRQNRLVISDFGLSRFHSEKTKSADPYDSLLGLSPTYRAPECDLRLTINQKYDIWALGCVFLEFLSWFVLDDTIEDFVNVRLDDERGGMIQEDKFFVVVDHKAQVKKSVKKWMDKIRSSKKCTRFIHDFVDVIERDLLVPDVENRKYCEEVVNELKVLQIRCRKDDGYCVQPIPQTESSNSEGKQPMNSPTLQATSRPDVSPILVPAPDEAKPGPDKILSASPSEGDAPAARDSIRVPRPCTPTAASKPDGRQTVPGSADSAENELVQGNGEEGREGLAEMHPRRTRDAETAARHPPSLAYGDSTLKSSYDSSEGRYNYSQDTSQNASPPRTGVENSIERLPPLQDMSEFTEAAYTLISPSDPHTSAPPSSSAVPRPQQPPESGDDRQRGAHNGHQDEDDAAKTSGTSQHQIQVEEVPSEESPADVMRAPSSPIDQEHGSRPMDAGLSRIEEGGSTSGVLSPEEEGGQQLRSPSSAPGSRVDIQPHHCDDKPEGALGSSRGDPNVNSSHNDFSTATSVAGPLESLREASVPLPQISDVVKQPQDPEPEPTNIERTRKRDKFVSCFKRLWCFRQHSRGV